MPPLLCSCGLFTELEPKAQRALDMFECRVRALTPHCGEVYDVESLVRDILQGRANPVRVLEGLGATLPEIAAVGEAWNACDTRPVPLLPPEYLPAVRL